MKPNFELVTELSSLNRRDFYLATESLLNPLDANPLVDGEYLELDAAYKLARGAAGEGLSALVFPVHAERGRTDTQAIGRTSVIFAGQYEAETKLITLAGLAVGDALTVNDVNGKRGLAKAGATVGRVVVGYVTRLMGNGSVRFLHMANTKV